MRQVKCSLGNYFVLFVNTFVFPDPHNTNGLHEPACADPECFLRGGPTLTTFCFVLFVWGGGGDNEGREDPKSTISGQSTARQRNADDGPTMIEYWLGGFVIFSGDPGHYC